MQIQVSILLTHDVHDHRRILSYPFGLKVRAYRLQDSEHAMLDLRGSTRKLAPNS